MTDPSIPGQRAINCGKAVAEHLLQTVVKNLGAEMASGCFTGTGLHSLGRIVEKFYPEAKTGVAASEPAPLPPSGLADDGEPGGTAIPEPTPVAPGVLILIQAIKKRIAQSACRVAQLATDLTATPEMIEEAINAKCSGLVIAQGGWVKPAKA